MASMSYCLFENTASDLERCVKALKSNKHLSESENNYKEVLYGLARSFIEAYENYKPVDKGFYLLDKSFFQHCNYSIEELEKMVALAGYANNDAIAKYDVSTCDYYDNLREAVEGETYDDYDEVKEKYFIVGYNLISV